MAGAATEFLFECFWPGLTEADVLALEDVVVATVASMASEGERVTYLGSLVMSEDEVVICRFSGSERAARRAAETAGIPFARLVVGTRSPRSANLANEPGSGGAAPH